MFEVAFSDTFSPNHLYLDPWVLPSPTFKYRSCFRKKWLLASMPANKWQGIFVVFHHVFCPAEPAQQLLIQSPFVARDAGFQMRLCYNESDMSIRPLSSGEGVCHLSQILVFVLIQFSAWAVIHLFLWNNGDQQLQAWSWNKSLNPTCHSVSLWARVSVRKIKMIPEAIRVGKSEEGPWDFFCSAEINVHLIIIEYSKGVCLC